MASPSKLCSACLSALQSCLKDVGDKGKELYKDCTHHTSFSEFQDAVGYECFICVKLWDSITDESLTNWSKDPVNWTPFKCQLERRPWAPKWYGAVYWHILYLVFEIGRVDFKFKGNVFCLFPIDESKPSYLENKSTNFESSTSSVKVHRQAYDWYKSCHESHKTCQRLGFQGKFAPSRLIDVGTENDNNWKLCLYPEDISEPPKYMTLSYRWARNPTIVLLGSNIEDFRRGAPINNLPKTFIDAITVTRNFSIRYLWIDSLCIVQDSPDDWARESTRMHGVYSNSSCNIAASASDSPEEGLFRPRVAKDSLSGYITVNFPDDSHKKYDIWDQSYIDRLTQGPLTNRGWIFQERVLSPRLLHFSQSQIAWECSEMNKCEMFPNWSPYPAEAKFSRRLKMADPLFKSDSHSLSTKQEDKKMSIDAFDQWNHLIQAYSQCTLTRPDDRLIAMSGIAEMYKKHTGDEYLAGLWRSRITEGLNWVVVKPISRPLNRFRVPSWSWAAVDSAILSQQTHLPRDVDLIEVINAVAETPKKSAEWQHINGSIELRGCLSKATVAEASRVSSMSENVTLELVDLPSEIYAYPDTVDMTFENGKILYLLPIRSTLRRKTTEEGTEVERLIGTSIILEGIIMEPVPKIDTFYRRIGWFVVASLDHISFFGLLAIPPWPGADPTRVIVDDTKTSVITLV